MFTSRDTYSHFVKELRACAGTKGVVSEEQTTALIGCAEMVVVAASRHRKKISFQNVYVLWGLVDNEFIFRCFLNMNAKL